MRTKCENSLNVLIYIMVFVFNSFIDDLQTYTESLQEFYKAMHSEFFPRKEDLKTFKNDKMQLTPKHCLSIKEGLFH